MALTLTFNHPLNISVNIFGLEVRPGDLIHADIHGAMVIEKKYIEKKVRITPLAT